MSSPMQKLQQAVGEARQASLMASVWCFRDEKGKEGFYRCMAQTDHDGLLHLHNNSHGDRQGSVYILPRYSLQWYGEWLQWVASGHEGDFLRTYGWEAGPHPSKLKPEHAYLKE